MQEKVEVILKELEKEGLTKEQVLKAIEPQFSPGELEKVGQVLGTLGEREQAYKLFGFKF